MHVGVPSRFCVLQSLEKGHRSRGGMTARKRSNVHSSNCLGLHPNLASCGAPATASSASRSSRKATLERSHTKTAYKSRRSAWSSAAASSYVLAQKRIHSQNPPN